jgi:hypothetical protein
MLASFLVFGVVAANAQGGGMRRTVEERVAIVHAKADSAFKLDKTTLANFDSTFANYYRAQDKLREEMTNGGGQPDFQAMREKMQPLMEDRDKKLQAVLTADQYKVWKEQIEPSMRPQRRQQQ